MVSGKLSPRIGFGHARPVRERPPLPVERLTDKLSLPSQMMRKTARSLPGDTEARLPSFPQRQAEEALRSWAASLEQRLAERTQALRVSEAQLVQSEKLAAIGQLAGGIAHEINNPLASILVFARTAARDLPPDHPSRRDLLEIETAARRCKAIVESLLTFSRRSPNEERHLVDLAALVRQCLPLLQAACKATIRVETEPTPTVMANANRLQQVVINLATNADHAAGQHGTIAIRVRGEFDRAVLEVEDDGPGIAPEHLPHIFEPFFTTKPVGQGTGLGLAIVYGIVRDHAGEIAVENLQPQGVRFTVKLPAAE